MKIIISVVCYNNEDEIAAFAEMLNKQTMSSDIELVVTCNLCNAPEKFRARLGEIRKGTRVFCPEKNLGYLHGCLYGVERYGGAFDWAILSNTDITFKKESFIEDLLSSCEKDNDVWAIAPNTFRSSNGVQQNPFCLSRPSCRRMWLWKTAYSTALTFSLYFLLAAIKRKIKKEEVEHIDSGYIYAEDGSFFMLHRDCIRALQGEKDDIFMYGEELLIAEIISENGKKIFYDKDAILIHNENSTTGKILSRQKQKWFKKSYRYLFQRFFSSRGVS